MNVDRAIAQYVQDNGHMPSRAALAAATGLPEKRCRVILREYLERNPNSPRNPHDTAKRDAQPVQEVEYTTPRPARAYPPTPSITAERTRRIVILSDIHIPHDDLMLIQKILAWMKTQHLDTVILNGDTLDCESISKYLKNDAMSLSDELARGNAFLDLLSEAARAVNPACKIVWIDGNHEERLKKLLMAQANQLIDLEVDGEAVVSIPHLLSLKRRRIQYLSYSETYELPGNLFVEHGHNVSQHSGYTVANAMRKLGGSIIMGHVHRIGAHYKTDRMGIHRGFEQGCLCLDASYLPQKSANWQRGFGVVDYFGETDWHYTQVVAQDRRFVIDGQVW